MKELRLKLDSKEKLVVFGIADTDREIEAVYGLRHEIYSKKGYINEKSFPDDLELDDYDREGKCVYFKAEVDGRIIGTVRLVEDDFLPTERYFIFPEPEEMKKVPREKRSEVGRLVIKAYSGSVRFPRNLVLLFLMDCLAEYCVKEGFTAGYSFVKTSLLEKLRKLRVPFHEVKNHIQVYPHDGALRGFFYQPDDRVVPLYFLLEEMESYLKGVINDDKMFSVLPSGEFVLKASYYNTFLRLLKII